MKYAYGSILEQLPDAVSDLLKPLNILPQSIDASLSSDLSMDGRRAKCWLIVTGESILSVSPEKKGDERIVGPFLFA